MPELAVLTPKTSEQTQISRRNSVASDLVPIASLFVFFLAATLFISPVGKFPVNDDWMYSYAVKCFMESGRFVFVGPNCTSCLLHVILGAALCKPFGFSHELLRTLT